MVKIKGFTLIELMVVFAIIGILISLVLGPINARHTEQRRDSDNIATESDIVINGIAHTCNEVGQCEPVD